MEGQMEDIGLPKPKMEYLFHPRRKWRFDFAWPQYMIAVEVEGGIHNGGRHVTSDGFTKDCKKYNEAAYLGWRVIRVTSDMLQDKSGIIIIAKILGFYDEDEYEQTRVRNVRRTNKIKSSTVS